MESEFSDNTDAKVFTGVLNNAKIMRSWIELPASDAPEKEKHKGINS